MSPLRAAWLPALAVVAVTLAFGGFCTAFVRQPQLASFADDSVSYLIMAQGFSPWHAASAPVVDAFQREAFYPPLFPLLLALGDAAHDLARAHSAEALFLAASLPLTYALGCRWLGQRWAAAAAATLVALVPALWINAKGILSEPLYCLLLLATLYAAGLQSRKSRLALVGGGLALLALTRSAGLALALSYAAWALSRRAPGWRERILASVPAWAGVAAYGLWVLLRPDTAADPNVGLLTSRWGEIDPLHQAHAMADAWVGSFIVYWVQGRPMQTVLAAAVGALALAGLVLRVRAGKADGWIMAAYGLTVLLWPFDEQMGRFIFPAIPVLTLYAFVAAERSCALLRRPAALGDAVLAALIAALVIPPAAFLYHRAQANVPEAAMTEWYRTPDVDAARTRARVHLDLLADMQDIRAFTAPSDKVAWVAPAYVALLADRFGVRAPPAALQPAAYRAALARSAADFAFVSVYHPRDTVSDAAWRAGVAALYGHAKLVNVHAEPQTNKVTSMLFKAPAVSPAPPR